MGDSGSHTAVGAVDQPGQKQPPSSQIRARERVVFGKYELLHRLRLGGMAEVWKARETAPPARTLALKRILPSFTDEADYVAMFVDEARLSMRLSHPGVVRAYELGRIEDEHFIALELVEGQELAALIRDAQQREEALSPALVCRIAIAVCDALHYAHELCDEHGAPLGIVHRDVSPQNVLLSYDGDVKLIDFGIAKSSAQLMRTEAGLLKGKHGYLSPEQAQGQSVDRRSDVFSLGICMYELLAARRLFAGSSDFSTLAQVKKAEIPALEGQNRDVPVELATIVHRALARERGARFQSALELRRALQSFVTQSGASCDRKALGHFVRERFRDVATAADGVAKRDEDTGLLAAFDALEPVTAVSALNDMAALNAAAAQATPAAGTVRPPSEPADEEAGRSREPSSHEPSSHEPPSSKAPATEANGPQAGEAETRVVSYESTHEGQLTAPDTQPAREQRPTPQVRSVPRAEQPRALASQARGAMLDGIGLEWSDEELSTQIYDPPEDGVGIAPAAQPPARAARPTPTPRSLPGASVPPTSAMPAVRASLPVRVEGLPPRAPATASLRPPRPTPSASVSLDSAAVASGLPPRPQRSTPAASIRSRRPTPGGFGASLPPVRVSVPPPQGTPTFGVHSELRMNMPPMGSNRASAAPLRELPLAHPGPSRAALAWAAAAAAIIVAAVVAGVTWFGQPEPATLHVTTQPFDCAVAVDGVVVPGTASPFVASELSPDVDHDVEVSRPGYRSWRTRLRLRSGAVVVLPEVQLQRETATSASPLTNESTAETAVPAVRAVPAPVVPTAQQLPAPVTKPSTATSAARRGPVRARPRTPLTTTVQPKPPAAVAAAPAPIEPASPRIAASEEADGTLRINSRPWSRVYIDGRLVGNTPQMQLTLSPGWHTVTLVNPEFGVQKVLTIRIKPGESTTKIVDLGG